MAKAHIAFGKVSLKSFIENDHCPAKLTTRRICLRNAVRNFIRNLEEKTPLKSDYRFFS